MNNENDIINVILQEGKGICDHRSCVQNKYKKDLPRIYTESEKSTAFKNKGYFPISTNIKELMHSLKESPIFTHPHFMHGFRSSGFGHQNKESYRDRGLKSSQVVVERLNTQTASSFKAV